LLEVAAPAEDPRLMEPPAGGFVLFGEGPDMSKLKELVSKGVRLIVVDSQEATAAAPEGLPAGREIKSEDLQPAEPAPVVTSSVPADVADFGAVYQEAGIELPPHGYGVDKVAEMLASKRLASLGREVKATAVLAALEAAGVPVKDVIQDGVARDKALDAFEAAKERQLRELRARNEARIQQTKEEIEAFLREKNAGIEGLKSEADAAAQAFSQLQARKQREEERLYEIVSHFAEGLENPITASSRPSAPPPPRRGEG